MSAPAEALSQPLRVGKTEKGVQFRYLSSNARPSAGVPAATGPRSDDRALGPTRAIQSWNPARLVRGRRP
jgi:hypothetical protein